MDDLFNHPVLVYVTVEGLRVYWAHNLLQKSPDVCPSSIILLSESFKFIFALGAFQYSNGDFVTSRKRLYSKGIKTSLLYLIAASLYLLNNNIYINLLPFTSPSLLQACVLLKIPITAILQHIWVEKQRSALAWSSIVWLSLGIFSLTLPAKNIIALAAGTLIALSSSVASIAIETSTESFWELQLYLSFFATILSMATYPLARFWPLVHVEVKGKADSSDPTLAVIVLALLTASGGFLAAHIIRKRGHLTKTVVAVPIMVSISLYQYDRVTGITFEGLPAWKGFAGILVIVAAILYHKHNNCQLEEYQYMNFHSQDPESFPLQDSLMKNAEAQEDQNDQVDELPPKHEPPQPTPRLAFVSSTISCGLFPAPTMEGWLPVVMVFCPSFLDFRSCSKQAAKSYSTTYLDGMRGLAALFVFFNHSMAEWYLWAFHGYDGAENNYLIQLPWIRVIVNGSSMVCIFYVVSGISISYRPLMLLRQGDIPKFNSTVASFIFRRHMRLFIPIFGVTFCAMLARYFGLFTFRGGEIQAPRSDIFFRQVEHWWWNTMYMANPFGMLNLDLVLATTSIYDTNMWTIPFEFRGSMIVYLVLICSAYIGTSRRLALVAMLATYSLYYVLWDLFLFLTGLFLAEIHLICEEKEHQEQIAMRPRPSRVSLWAQKILWSAYFFAAVGLLSVPMPAAGVWYWPHIWQWTPRAWAKVPTEWWGAIAAVQTVFIVDRAKFLQVLFTNRWARYQGRISFSMYIVHGSVLRTFGRRFAPFVVSSIGFDTYLKRGIGITIGFSGVVMVTIYLADLSTRVFDEGAVKFAKWAYGALCKTPSGVHNRRP